MKKNIAKGQPCIQCGNPIELPYAKEYCSLSCRTAALNRKRWGERTLSRCTHCGNDITAYGPRQYCSIRCRNIAMSHRAANKTRKHPKPQPRINPWTDEAIQYVRDHYATDGAQAVAKHLNMSISMVYSKAYKLGLKQHKETVQRVVYERSRQRMRNDNPMKRPDVQAKVIEWWNNNPEASQKRSTAFLHGKQAVQRDKPTKLEQRLFAILDEIGVSYEPYALIKPRFIVDVRIGMLILQADGEYWHGHPRFEPLTERQQKQQTRDRSQDTYLQSCGYTVIRIWDRDVHKDHIQHIIELHRSEF